MTPLMQGLTGVAVSKYKTNLCRHFATTGTCTMGVRCHFAHGQEELRNPSDPIDINPAVANDPTVMAGLGGIGATNFKTIKCRYYELGICKYQEGCHFAHGDNDSKQAGMDQSSLNQMVLAQQYAALLQQKEKLLQQNQETQETQESQQEMEKRKMKELQEQADQLLEQKKQQASGGTSSGQTIPGTNFSQPPQYSVSKDPQVQKEITTKQLDFLYEGLLKLNLSNENRFKLKVSRQLTDVQNISGSSLLINEVVINSEQNPQLKDSVNKLVDETSELAVTLMAEYQIKFQQQQEESQKKQQELYLKQQELMQQQQALQQQQMQQQQQGGLPPQGQPVPGVILPQSIPPIPQQPY